MHQRGPPSRERQRADHILDRAVPHADPHDLDESSASQLLAAAATRFRFLEGARVRRIFPLEDRVGVLVDRLDDQGYVQYDFALVVADVASNDVAFVVTAEVSELAAGTSQPHILGRFDGLGHHNHGRGDFRDIEVFASRALELVRQLY